MPDISVNEAYPAEDFNQVQPHPASSDERDAFNRLQKKFSEEYEAIFPDISSPKCVVIIPSLSVDQEILSKVNGYVHYEERLLCLLMLLRMPRTHVIYLTSMPIDPVIVDYYLHLLPGITGYHARQRLTLLSCYDASRRPLTQKILERPRLVERIKKSIPAGISSYIACFNMSGLERTLSVQLGLPIYGCDPDLLHLGTKSGSRRIFKECGIPLPEGIEDLEDEQEVIEGLYEIKRNKPSLERAVIKLNDGFSGDGNGIFSFNGETNITKQQLKQLLRRNLKFVAHDLVYDQFMEKFRLMGGVVEEFIPGEIKKSPSVQCRINPLGRTEVISTHDQVLGSETGQVFIGANFPAHGDYARDIGIMGGEIARSLRDHGVWGRFSADFVSVKENNQWKHYALEINLRKGGTTHPFLMLMGLTNGGYDVESGVYLTANGQKRYYFSSDNVNCENCLGYTSHDLIDIAIYNRLQYDGSLQQGVMFHLIGALSEYGKLGVVCIGSTPGRANAFYRRTLQVLNREGKMLPAVSAYDNITLKGYL